MNMLQWLEANKQWVFSGLGVAAISAVGSLVIALCSWCWARRINPEEFQRCFSGWVQAAWKRSEGQVIALDGKTLRRSYDSKSSKAAIHMVSAYCLVMVKSYGDTSKNMFT